MDTINSEMASLLSEINSEDKSIDPTIKITDPINLPAEIREKIFADLSGEDLIQCCLVSYQWDFSVRPSLAYKKKVRLSIFPWSDINMIASHANILNFENISLSNFRMGPEISFLEKIAWKKAIIKINLFPTEPAYTNYLAYFNESVEDLKIVNADIRISGIIDVKLVEFPNMKALELNNVSAAAVQPFVCNQRNLETLNLKCLFESILDPVDKDMMIGNVIQMLRYNSGLKTLILHSDVSNQIFKHDFNEVIDFNLTHLTLCSDFTRASGMTLQDHIFRFLIQQLKTLESLKLVFRHDCSVQSSYRPVLFHFSPNKAADFEIIIKVWNYTRNLKKLAIRFMLSKTIGELAKGQRLRTNTNITELHMIFDSHINSVRNCYVLSIIKACPNLRKLRVRYLSNEFFEYLVCYMMNLRVIECYIYGEGLHDTYIKMKNKDYKVNENIVVVGIEKHISQIQEQYRDVRINY